MTIDALSAKAFLSASHCNELIGQTNYAQPPNKADRIVISWAAWSQQSSEVVQALDLSKRTLDVNRTIRLKRKPRAET
eukprot:2965848-Pleurochrysis_carterae.AAC.1